MNAEQTMVYRVLLISGSRALLDERLGIRMYVCDPIDTLTLELADCMDDDKRTLSILEAHQRTMPAPDEEQVFTLLWNQVCWDHPEFTKRDALLCIDDMLHAAGAVNPHVLTLIEDYELMDEGIFSAEQVDRAVGTYVVEHRLIDLYTE